MSTGGILVFCDNDSSGESKEWREPGDTTIEDSYDACVIQFEFQCENTNDEVSIDYVFASDEYMEYVGDEYKDAARIFMNDVNIATVPDPDGNGGKVPISIDSVNDSVNANLFIQNDDAVGEPYSKVEADGFTTLLTAKATPVAGWNTMKIVIADVGDGELDSWFALSAGSLTCASPGGGGGSKSKKKSTKRTKNSCKSGKKGKM